MWKLLALHNWVLLPNDNVLMPVGHLDHVLLTVYSLMEHVTGKSLRPMCGWVHDDPALHLWKKWNSLKLLCTLWIQTHKFFYKTTASYSALCNFVVVKLNLSCTNWSFVQQFFRCRRWKTLISVQWHHHRHYQWLTTRWIRWWGYRGLTCKGIFRLDLFYSVKCTYH